MSDILSQNEIDALLNALNTGEVDVVDIKEDQVEGKAKIYDFKSPKKLAKDQLKTLQIIHENFSRTLNTFLSGYLRTYVKTEVLSVEELSYYEFSNSIVNPALLAIVDFCPLDGQIIMDISSIIAFTLIDRILGGQGEKNQESRPFTEIEKTLIENVLKQLTSLMVDPWENVIELEPRLDKIETNSQFAQIVSPNETTALITLNLKIGEVEGFLNICIPHIIIEPILPKLSTTFWFANVSKQTTEMDKRIIEKRLINSPVNINVELGHTHITVEEFLGLQLGDVIALDSNINKELEIRVGNKRKYYGIPGSMKNKVAIKITRVEERRDEPYE